MKKIIASFVLIVLSILVVGCNNKTSIWTLDLDSNRADMEEEALEVFNKAAKSKYEVVALLGKQLTAGTNYMYLCRDDSYKVVVIYKDLEDKVSIISEKEFDVTKYVNEKITPKYQGVVGGWQVKVPNRKTPLEDEIREAFDHASEKLEGIRYYPAALLAHQSKSGTNYALLAYGEVEEQDNSTGVYVLTLYKDLHGTEEIVGYAYVDLSEYNQ